MDYRHIPVLFESPTVENFWEFVEAMDELSGERVFVHCASNYRVSCFIALYGQLRLGWTFGEANRHVRAIWTPNDTWEAFVSAVRRRFGLAESRHESDRGSP